MTSNADYTPTQCSVDKLKKSTHPLSIACQATDDIILSISKSTPSPMCVGFAAETSNVIEYAKKKRAKKNLDLIIANDVSRADIGFNSTDNALHLITKDTMTTLEKQSKRECATKILKYMADIFEQRDTALAL